MAALDEPASVSEYSAENFAFSAVEALLAQSSLPMNFVVTKNQDPKRSQNAYAEIDEYGIRHIKYDDDWLKSLDSNPRRLESYTVLSHEIGHHLAGHTLDLDKAEILFKHSQYCREASGSYDQKICDREVLKFYQVIRLHELEADRFAGYMMFNFGAKLEEVQRVFNDQPVVSEDPKSTHPIKAKRLAAVKAGYQLAVSDRKRNVQRVDLISIRGSKNEFKFTADALSKINHNRLINKIRAAALDTASSRVKSKDNFVYGSAYDQSKTIPFESKFNANPILSNMSFSELELFGIRLFAQVDAKFDFVFDFGVIVEDRIVTLVRFTEQHDAAKIIYRAPFVDKQISAEEIAGIFFEIYTNQLAAEIENRGLLEP